MKDTLAASGNGSGIEVVNVPGGNGTVGLGRFLSDPTGGQALVTGLTMLNAMLVRRSPLSLDQMAPLARLATDHFVVVVPAGSTMQSIGDLRTAFQTEPGRISWGGGPTGSIDHVGALLMASASGLPPAALNYVPFLATGDAVAALADGRVSAAFLPSAELGAAIQAGRVRVLAIASSERLSGASIPTLRESGIDLEFANWRGLVGPPGLPEDEKAANERLLTDLAGLPRWKEALESKGWQAAYLPPAAFATFLAAEHSRVKAVLTAAGVLTTTLAE
jgi:putative tricarboxylic transport membrane protein